MCEAEYLLSWSLQTQPLAASFGLFCWSWCRFSKLSCACSGCLPLLDCQLKVPDAACSERLANAQHCLWLVDVPVGQWPGLYIACAAIVVPLTCRLAQGFR